MPSPPLAARAPELVVLATPPCRAPTAPNSTSGQHGSPWRSSSRSWWWALVVAATTTVCVVNIVRVVTAQPSGVNTQNGWSDLVRTQGNLRPLPAHRIDQELGSSLGKITSFSMTKIRTYKGPRFDPDGVGTLEDVSRFPASEEKASCDRWAVTVSSSPTVGATEAVRQLATMKDWCVLIVGHEKNGPEMYHAPGVTYLSFADQDALPYQILKIIPPNHFGRKNVGYLYAIHHGAKVIYDLDDANTAIHPEEGIPYSDSPFVISAPPTTSVGGARDHHSVVHNPYPCFGAPGGARPRGFPLAAVKDPASSSCSVAGPVSAGEGELAVIKGTPLLLGVVQFLANHEPDVDAVCHLALSPEEGGLSFDFVGGGAGMAEEGERRDASLEIVPELAFTPYNAQATLHFSPAFWGLLLPITVNERVSDIWRSYFTQALLPATGAVTAVAAPWVTRSAQSRDVLADFKAEFELYERSEALVSYLAANWRQTNAPKRAAASVAAGPPSALSPTRIQDLVIDMYEHGIVAEEDVALTRAWLEDLLAVGYAFSPPAESIAVEGAGNVAANAEPDVEGEAEGQAAFAADGYPNNPVEFAEGVVPAKHTVAAESSAPQTADVTSRTLAELEVTGAKLRGKNGREAQRKVQAEAEIGMKEVEDGDKPSVLLVIAVVTIRSERRTAVRDSWLAWGDDRVVLRFFTEAPYERTPEDQAEARALEEESATYGDLVVLDIERGMNFAVKLLAAMKYVSVHHKFDFFLRLDDDYFLCLERLLDELEATKNSLTGKMTLAYEEQNPPLPQLMLYAGYRYCKPRVTRVDEAYMLLSGALVHRVLSITDLRCESHAGVTAGWWFTVGHDANKDGDVRWVHDPRLDHRGSLVEKMMIRGAAPSTYASVCEEHMGVHHAYPEEMAVLWEAAKDTPKPRLPEGKETAGGETAEFPYLTEDTCQYTAGGVDTSRFERWHDQLCETFHSGGKVHCGAQGC